MKVQPLEPVMRHVLPFGLALGLAALAGELQAQPSRATDEQFLKAKPSLGDPLPELTVRTPDGQEFNTASLRGHYTVLTFGCLT